MADSEARGSQEGHTKVVICGSRTWPDPDAIHRRLDQLPADTELIHGAASGADQIAANYAGGLGMRVQPFYADWISDGKRAGVLRNLAMLDENPDLVIAFHHRGSRGTAHTIREARRRGIPVEVFEA